jgi:hypothetical protein
MLINDNPFVQSLADKCPVRNLGKFLGRVDEAFDIPARNSPVEILQQAVEPLEVRLARSLHKDQIDIAFRALAPSCQGTKKDRFLNVVALKNRSALTGDDLCVDFPGSLSSD